MGDLSFAMIGAGFWAQYQLAAWQQVPGARCVAVCDQDQAKAARLAEQYRVPRSYSDAATMMKQESLDFVDIVTSIPGHVPMIELAISHQLPSICQKPLDASREACERVVRKAQKAKVPLLVHENWRWQAPLRRVKEVLESGAIGQPFRARIDMISGFDVYANQPNLRTDERFILADMGCHLLDLARCYFGDIETVYCRTQRVHPDIRGEDVATILLGMISGQSVMVNMAYAETPLEKECFPETLVFIEGERGSIETTPGCWVHVTTAEGTHRSRVLPQRFVWVDPEYAVAQASMVPCIRNLLAALRHEGEAETHGKDNLKTMQAVFAAYDSAASGQPIRMVT